MFTSRGAPEQKRFSCSASTPCKNRSSGDYPSCHLGWIGIILSRPRVDLEHGELGLERLHVSGGGDIQDVGLLASDDQLHRDFWKEDGQTLSPRREKHYHSCLQVLEPYGMIVV